MGRQTQFVEVSALQKLGISDLFDAILLQAELLDLKANYDRLAEGKVIESRIDQGRGIAATLMVQMVHFISVTPLLLAFIQGK